MAIELQTEALAEAVIVSQSHAGAAHGASFQAHEQHSCANCGATLTGKFCHSCGQAAHVHKSLLHLVEEFLHGFFHFETKSWRTIPALIFKPGQLTRNYIDGQRVRFVSPLALFLFLIFMMFFVFSLGTQKEAAKINQDPLVVQKHIIAVDENLQKKLLRQKSVTDAESRAELDDEIKKLQLKLGELKAKLIRLQKEQAQEKARKLAEEEQDEADTSTKVTAPAQAKTGASSSDAKTSQMSRVNSGISLAFVFKEIKEKFDSGELTFSSLSMVDQRLRKVFEPDDFNAELLAYKLKSAASKFAFVLLPISLPFIWLLFIFRRRFSLFDHAVFALYSLSFMAILMMLLRVASALNWQVVLGLSIFFIPPLHIYKHLKGTYLLSRFAALWRTFVLLFVALLALAAYCFFLLLFAI